MGPMKVWSFNRVIDRRESDETRWSRADFGIRNSLIGHHPHGHCCDSREIDAFCKSLEINKQSQSTNKAQLRTAIELHHRFESKPKMTISREFRSTEAVYPSNACIAFARRVLCNFPKKKYKIGSESAAKTRTRNLKKKNAKVHFDLFQVQTTETELLLSLVDFLSVKTKWKRIEMNKNKQIQSR